eukprot:TRINITY_DN13803_c0_g1_i2.p1 TRINITY_DN13803_c0_g1~~TRINITY_DN13803_c0_g1_i2.p1  ORF type:complete len:307 (-),score=29.06 TRINITY_DN13803_c0_g1_i2:452-1264(-)
MASSIFAKLEVGCRVRCVVDSEHPLEVGRCYEVVGWHTDSGKVVGTVNHQVKNLIAVRLGPDDRNSKTGWWNVEPKYLMVRKSQDTEKQLRMLEHARMMAAGFASLTEFHDVTVQVQDASFTASSIVLSSASMAFRKRLHSEVQPAATKQIVLKDTCALAVKAMLHFITHGELNCSDQELPEVVRIADTYDLPLLVQAAAGKMSEAIKPETVVADVRVLRQLSHNPHVEDAYSEVLTQLQFDSAMFRTLVDGLCQHGRVPDNPSLRLRKK